MRKFLRLLLAWTVRVRHCLDFCQLASVMDGTYHLWLQCLLLAFHPAPEPSLLSFTAGKLAKLQQAPQDTTSV